MTNYRWVVRDVFGNDVDEIHPLAAGEITCTTASSIARAVSSVLIPADEASAVDPWRHRLCPYAVDDDGDHPLGVFIPQMNANYTGDLAAPREVGLLDLGFLLTWTVRMAFGIAARSSLGTAIRDLFVTLGLDEPKIDVPGQDATVAEFLAGKLFGNRPGAAPAGTTGVEIAARLCEVAGVTRPWWDVNGQAWCSLIPYAGETTPKRAFTRGAVSLIAGDTPAREEANQWSVPTEWLVTSKATTAILAGRYVLPDTHPLSPMTTGRQPLLKAVEIAGLTSSAECADRARDLAQRDTTVNRTVVFQTTNPVWDLEPNDVVTFEGEELLLSSWTVPLAVGGRQQITLRQSLAAEAA